MYDNNEHNPGWAGEESRDKREEEVERGEDGEESWQRGEKTKSWYSHTLEINLLVHQLQTFTILQWFKTFHQSQNDQNKYFYATNTCIFCIPLGQYFYWTLLDCNVSIPLKLSITMIT